MVVFFRECPQLKLFYEENSRSGRGISFGRWPRGWEDFVKYFPRDGTFILFTPKTSSMRTLFFHLTTPLVTKVMCSLVRLFIPLVSLRAFANLFAMAMGKRPQLNRIELEVATSLLEFTRNILKVDYLFYCSFTFFFISLQISSLLWLCYCIYKKRGASKRL